MADQVVEPGQDICPQIDLPEAITLAERLYGLKVDNAIELVGYDDKNYHLMVLELPINKNIVELWPHGYILKVMNSSDTKKHNYIQAQCEMMVHFDKYGITTPQPQRNIEGKYFSIEKLPNDGGKESKEHAVRLLTFQDGTLMKDVPWSFKLHYEVGKYTANLNLVLKEFSHSAYDTYSSLWCLKNAPSIKKYMFVVENAKRVDIVKSVIKSFEEDVLSVYHSLGCGMIHGDIHDQNLLCKQDGDGEWYINAVLDLGDAHFSAYVFELALAAAYMMLWSEQVESGTHVIAGYCSLHLLPLQELNLLKVCVCTRLCQSLVLGLYTNSQHPSNEYVLSTQAAGWKLLEAIWTTDSAKLEDLWFRGLSAK